MAPPRHQSDNNTLTIYTWLNHVTSPTMTRSRHSPAVFNSAVWWTTASENSN